MLPRLLEQLLLRVGEYEISQYRTSRNISCYACAGHIFVDRTIVLEASLLGIFHVYLRRADLCRVNTQGAGKPFRAEGAKAAVE